MLSTPIRLIRAAVVIAGCIGSTSCSLVVKDLPECPEGLFVRFIYDRNLKWADAFAHEVKSVNVWAFDEAGTLVWSGAAAGEELSAEGFSLATPLPAGTYDFVAWCGLEGNPAVEAATYTPAAKEELAVHLTVSTDDSTAGDGVTATTATYNPGFYHGIVEGYRYTVDPAEPSIHTVTIPLTKDNNDLRIMLQHLDGTAIDQGDFSVAIADANGHLEWDNAIAGGCPTVVYTPWNTKYGQVTAPSRGDSTRDVTTVASLLFEFSTSRLMAGHEAVLTVRRHSDGRDIIRIPLIDYLLLIKGHYRDLQGNEISDQEYLDRNDDYSVVFFIDEDSNWYLAGGIIINGWAVVPPQESEF